MKKISQKFEDLVNVLIDNGAHCMWQLGEKALKRDGLPNYKSVECWQLRGGRLVIIQEWARCDGWDYYIQTKNSKFTDCMDELGLKAITEDAA